MTSVVIKAWLGLERQRKVFGYVNDWSWSHIDSLQSFLQSTMPLTLKGSFYLLVLSSQRSQASPAKGQ
jgi:hypothetical protein